MKRQQIAQTEVEKPAEESAGLALLDALVAFNAGSANRSALNADDLDALSELDVLQATYAEAALLAWAATNQPPERSPLTWGPRTPPEEVTRLAGLITAYASDCRDEEVVQLASGRTKHWPAVQSGLYRDELSRDGVAVVEALRAALAAGYERIRNARQKEHELRDAIRFWISHPHIRAIVEAIAAGDAANVHSSRRMSALDDLRSAQQKMLSEHRSEPIPHQQMWAHEHRGWLPIAREILEAEDMKKTEAAA